MRGIERTQTVGLIVLSFFSFIGSSLILSAILFSRNSRKRGFNLHLVFLVIPDIIINLFGLIWFSIELSMNESLIEKYCRLAVCWGFMYGYFLFANMYTNGLICNEVHQLLVKSRNATRFKQSRPKQVLLRASIVNVLAILNCCIREIILPLFKIGMNYNNCRSKWEKFDNVIDDKSTRIALFVNIVIVSVGIPLIFIIYVTIDVYWRKLLPPSGKSRFIATFFLRVAIISTVLTVFIFAVYLGSEVFFWLSGIAIHIQGSFVCGFSLLKPDIRQSVLRLLSCGSTKESEDDEDSSIVMAKAERRTSRRLSLRVIIDAL